MKFLLSFLLIVSLGCQKNIQPLQENLSVSVVEKNIDGEKNWHVIIDTKTPNLKDRTFEVRWNVGITSDWDIRDEVVLPANSKNIDYNTGTFILDGYREVKNIQFFEIK